MDLLLSSQPQLMSYSKPMLACEQLKLVLLFLWLHILLYSLAKLLSPMLSILPYFHCILPPTTLIFISYGIEFKHHKVMLDLCKTVAISD